MFSPFFKQVALKESSKYTYLINDQVLKCLPGMPAYVFFWNGNDSSCRMPERLKQKVLI